MVECGWVLNGRFYRCEMIGLVLLDITELLSNYAVWKSMCNEIMNACAYLAPDTCCQPEPLDRPFKRSHDTAHTTKRAPSIRAQRILYSVVERGCVLRMTEEGGAAAAHTRSMDALHASQRHHIAPCFTKHILI